MNKFIYQIGERVAGMYLRDGRTVLDYTGMVQAIERRDSRREWVTIRYAGGYEQVTFVHSDINFSMEPAFRYAAQFVKDAPGVEPSEESFAEVASGWSRRPDFWDTGRALWVLKYAREAV